MAEPREEPPRKKPRLGSNEESEVKELPTTQYIERELELWRHVLAELKLKLILVRKRWLLWEHNPVETQQPQVLGKLLAQGPVRECELERERQLEQELERERQLEQELERESKWQWEQKKDTQQLEQEEEVSQTLKQRLLLLQDKSQEMRVRQLGQSLMQSKRKEEQLKQKLMGLKCTQKQNCKQFFQDCYQLAQDLERLNQKWQRILELLQDVPPAKLRLELQQLEEELRKWKSEEEHLKQELRRFVRKQEWESSDLTRTRTQRLSFVRLKSKLVPRDKSLRIEQKLRQWIRKKIQLQRDLEGMEKKELWMELVWQFEVLDLDWEGLDWEWERWVSERLSRHDVRPKLEQELKQVLKIRKLDEDYLTQELEGRETTSLLGSVEGRGREQSERGKLEREPDLQRQELPKVSVQIKKATGGLMESSDDVTKKGLQGSYTSLQPEAKATSYQTTMVDLGKSQECCTPLEMDTLTLERKALIPLEDPSVTMLPDDPRSLMDPVEVILCDEKGGIYHHLTHGLTIQIPGGAIPAGMKLEISVGVLMQGNFDFPAELAPVSVIVWLCTTKPDFVFLRQIKVFIPHCIECKGNVEAARLQMQFMKASHFSSSANSFKFSPADGVQDFGTVTSKGILHTRHLCYLCLVAGTRSKDLRSKKLCVSCAEPIHYITGPLAIFFVTYDLDNCKKLVKSKLPTGYCITKERIFRFQTLSDAITGKFHCSDHLSHKAILHPSKISKERVDFSKLYRRKEEQRRLEDCDCYPPKMVLEVAELPLEAEFIKVTFKGTQEVEEEMEIGIRVPSNKTIPSRMGLERDVFMLTATHQKEAITELTDTPTVKQLLVMKGSQKKHPIRLVRQLAPRWELLGYALDFDPKGNHVQLIKRECTTEGGPLACCYRVLMDWLNGQGSCQPPTWAMLVEILEEIDECCLAQEIIDFLSR